MFVLTGPHVKHLVTEIKQCVQRQKNKSWPPIMPKQRERCLNIKKKRFFKKLSVRQLNVVC
jgi:hypothetical protein